MRLLDELMREKESVLSSGFGVKVERDLCGSGVHAVNRRCAIAFLSTPFKKTAASVRKDRDLAVSFAAIADALHGSIRSYKALTEMLTAAETRIMLQLCQRSDMAEIIAEAKKKNTAGPSVQDLLAEGPASVH